MRNLAARSAASYLRWKKGLTTTELLAVSAAEDISNERLRRLAARSSSLSSQDRTGTAVNVDAWGSSDVKDVWDCVHPEMLQFLDEVKRSRTGLALERIGVTATVPPLTTSPSSATSSVCYDDVKLSAPTGESQWRPTEVYSPSHKADPLSNHDDMDCFSFLSAPSLVGTQSFGDSEFDFANVFYPSLSDIRTLGPGEPLPANPTSNACTSHPSPSIGLSSPDSVGWPSQTPDSDWALGNSASSVNSYFELFGPPSADNANSTVFGSATSSDAVIAASNDSLWGHEGSHWLTWFKLSQTSS